MAGCPRSASLRAVPVVSDVRLESGEDGASVLTLRCRETTSALDTALAVLREARAPVREVRVVEPTLEDAFMHATGREYVAELAEGGES